MYSAHWWLYSNVYKPLVGRAKSMTLDWNVLRKFHFKEMVAVSVLGNNMFFCSETKPKICNRHSELHFDIWNVFYSNLKTQTHKNTMLITSGIIILILRKKKLRNGLFPFTIILKSAIFLKSEECTIVLFSKGLIGFTFKIQF